jgi:hypothetical protein
MPLPPLNSDFLLTLVNFSWSVNRNLEEFEEGYRVTPVHRLPLKNALGYAKSVRQPARERKRMDPSCKKVFGYIGFYYDRAIHPCA